MAKSLEEEEVMMVSQCAPEWPDSQMQVPRSSLQRPSFEHTVPLMRQCWKGVTNSPSHLSASSCVKM
jgi:hypothetical protein